MDSSVLRNQCDNTPAPDYGLACLRGWQADLSDPAAGHWRKRVYAKSYQAGQVVAGGHLNPKVAEDSLLEAGMLLWEATSSKRETNPMREVQRVVADGMRKGGGKPRKAPVLRASGRHAVAEQVLAWEAVALSRAWTGRAGGSQLALLRVMYRTAGEVGRLTLSESLRQLCERAGHTSHAVTDRALRKLAEAGWLRRASKPDRFRHGCSEWELLPPPGLEATTGTDRPVSVGLTEPAQRTEQTTSTTDWLDPAHDCWHQRQTAWRVAAWLAEHAESSVSAVSAGTGLHRSTVRRQLDWLAGEGLVAVTEVGGRERRTYAVVAGVSLAAVHSAERWPESPAQVRQRRHQHQRQLHSQWLSAVIAHWNADTVTESWLDSLEADAEALPPSVPAGGIGCAHGSATLSEA